MKSFPIRSTEYQVFHLIFLEFSQTNQNHEKNGCFEGICDSFNFKKRKSAFFDFKAKLQKKRLSMQFKSSLSHATALVSICQKDEW